MHGVEHLLKSDGLSKFSQRVSIKALYKDENVLFRH